MTMSKQHFEMIAGVLREAGKHNAVDPTFAEGWHAALAAVAVRFADEARTTNPRFNRGRFLSACAGQDSHDSAGRKVVYSK